MNLQAVVGIFTAMLIAWSAQAAGMERYWGLAMAKNETGEVVKTIRYRSAMPVWVKRGSYKAVVILSWPNLNQAAMPSSTEATLHHAFETRTRAAQESAKAAVLATVIQGEGKIEWMYYARTHEEFMRVFNKSRAGQMPIPLDIQLKQDPLWTKHLAIGDGK